jgi:hypothetical protein
MFYKFGEAEKCCGRELHCGMCNKPLSQTMVSSTTGTSANTEPSFRDLYLAYENKFRELFPNQKFGPLHLVPCFWRQYGKAIITSYNKEILSKDFVSATAEFVRDAFIVNEFSVVSKDDKNMYVADNADRVYVLPLEKEVTE